MNGLLYVTTHGEKTWEFSFSPAAVDPPLSNKSKRIVFRPVDEPTFGARVVSLSDLRLELLMNLPDLLFDIHPLHSFHILALLQLPVIARRRLFPTRCLLLANHGLPCHAVEYIATLRSEPLEIGSHIARRQVGG